MSIEMKIEAEQAIKLVEIVRAGLGQGANEDNPSALPCIENAVAIATGEEFTDRPSCAIPSARLYGYSLNDWKGWSSPQARGDALMRYGIAQLGSAGVVDDGEWLSLVTEMRFRENLPIVLRSVGTPDAAGDVAEGERILRLAAEIGVRAFKQLGSPGCELLWLAEPGAIDRYWRARPWLLDGEGE